MMKMAIRVAASMPPTTVVPRIWRELAPAPWETTNGKTPKMKANAVMRMGRSRSRAPASAASKTDVPRSYSVLQNSTMRMAFLAASPISITRPICPYTSRAKPRPQRPRNAPTTATGTESSTLNGSDQLS